MKKKRNAENPDKMKKLYNTMNLIAGFPTIYIWYILPFLPQFRFWEFGQAFANYRLILITGISLIVFIYSLYMIVVLEIHNLAVTKENYAAPRNLIIKTYYAKVRHPLTTFFIINIASLYIICSAVYAFICLPSLVFLSVWICFYEEREILIKQFREEYLRYKEKTPMLFNNVLKLVSVVIIVIVIYAVIQFKI
jgi:protein-S-isoprenylcysteine O-methyltransferase Ste14